MLGSGRIYIGSDEGTVEGKGQSDTRNEGEMVQTKKLRHVDQIVREVIEVELHLNNMKREGGFSLG
jgi:hypothetical protein